MNHIIIFWNDSVYKQYFTCKEREEAYKQIFDESHMCSLELGIQRLYQRITYRYY